MLPPRQAEQGVKPCGNCYGGSNWDRKEVVEKISIGATPLSTRYATALYALADEQNSVAETVDQMAAFGRLIRESDVFSHLVGSHAIDARQAAGPILQGLKAQGFSVLIQNFVGVIIANRRLRDLPALIAGFAAFAAAKRGEVVARVASAYPLTDLQRIQLRARLTEAGYSSVRLDETVEPSLLGGLTLKIGPKLYDTSLKSRLQRLQYSLKGAA